MEYPIESSDPIVLSIMFSYFFSIAFNPVVLIFLIIIRRVKSSFSPRLVHLICQNDYISSMR